MTLDPVYLLWVGYVLIWLISFWWYEFNFQALQENWTFGLYLFVISFVLQLLYMFQQLGVLRGG